MSSTELNSDSSVQDSSKNSPQGGVVLASQNNSFDSNHDSSIPDDDSLQSRPQPGQEWQHDWIDAAYDDYMQSLPDADKRAEYQAPAMLKAAIESRFQQLQQQHEAEVLEARIDTIVNAKLALGKREFRETWEEWAWRAAKYLNAQLAQLARLKQQQQERGTGGEEPHEPK
jgi:hypothetical protein